MHEYLSLDIIRSSKLIVFLELRSRKTVRFSEQIMSKDKYPCIFSSQMGTIVYLERVFHWLSKHLEFRQKYYSARRIFNSFLGDWIPDETLSLVFDILLQELGNLRRCSDGSQLLCYVLYYLHFILSCFIKVASELSKSGLNVTVTCA